MTHHHGLGNAALMSAIAFVFGRRAAQFAVGAVLLVKAAFVILIIYAAFHQ